MGERRALLSWRDLGGDEMLKAVDITGELFHHTVGDVETLHKLVDMLPSNPIIVNIGVCFGTSMIAFLEHRKDAYVVGIDALYCSDAVKNITEANLNAHHNFLMVVDKSQHVAISWPWSVDMVFVDGGHGYDDCYRDIILWAQSTKPGGIIAVHDYGTPSLPTVVQATDMAAETLDLKEILHVETIKAFRV